MIKLFTRSIQWNIVMPENTNFLPMYDFHGLRNCTTCFSTCTASGAVRAINTGRKLRGQQPTNGRLLMFHS